MFSEKENELLREAFEIYNSELCRSLPSDDQLTYGVTTPKYRRKINWLLKNSSGAFYPLINTALKRVACIIAVILLTATTVTVSVEGLREKAFRFIIDIFSEYTDLTIDDYEGGVKAGEVIPIIPSYIPEGFEQIERIDNPDSVMIDYKNSDGKTLHFMQGIIDGASLSINTEQNPHEYIEINGYQAIYYKHQDSNGMLLHTDDYYFMFNGELDKNELIKMAQSIF